MSVVMSGTGLLALPSEAVEGPPDVVIHEGRHEEVAVVVAGLATQRERDGRRPAGLLEALGAQLGLEEPVGGADVHEDRVGAMAGRDQQPHRV